MGKLFALPTALEAAGALTLITGGRRAHGLDRIGRGTELVCGDVRHGCSLAGSQCGMPSGPGGKGGLSCSDVSASSSL